MAEKTMHLVTLFDWDAARIRELLALAKDLKAQARAGTLEPTLERKTLALVFEKASMRTRVSFEVAMTQLGGYVTYLSKDDVNLGVREPVRDGARVLSRYVDGIAARVRRHETVELLAAHATIPVINALSDVAHPCQALGDVLTMQEHLGESADLKVAYIGDANNVARSLAVICARLGMGFVVGCPEGYGFDADFTARVEALASETGARIGTVHSPADAARDAKVLYTDVWVSMGQEEEAERRRRAFEGFCIDAALLGSAAEGAIVMHCLPAHRGEEITDEVIEGPQSVVFDQAENRLHAERALLQMLLAG